VALAAGAALRALVAANAPPLRSLNLCLCCLNDTGLRPLLDALPGNTHLRSLDISWNHMQAAFALVRLLPAVRANGSLTQLTTYSDLPAARDAEALVAARAAR
jgi:hypothetical protein